MSIQNVAKASILGVWANLWLFMLNRSDLQDSRRLENNNANFERPLIPTVLDKSASLVGLDSWTTCTKDKLQNGLCYQWCHGSKHSNFADNGRVLHLTMPRTSTHSSLPEVCMGQRAHPHNILLWKIQSLSNMHVHTCRCLMLIYNLQTLLGSPRVWWQTFRILSTYLVNGIWDIPRHCHQHGKYPRMWFVAWAPL